MRLIHRLLLAATLLSPSLAYAAPDSAAPISSEIRLSEAEKERILEAADASSRELPVQQVEEANAADAPGRQIHGEVGFEVGTGGYRSAYGTAIVPLDGDGVAVISLGSTDFGSRNRYFDPWWR